MVFGLLNLWCGSRCLRVARCCNIFSCALVTNLHGETFPFTHSSWGEVTLQDSMTSRHFNVLQNHCYMISSPLTTKWAYRTCYSIETVDIISTWRWRLSSSSSSTAAALISQAPGIVMDSGGIGCSPGLCLFKFYNLQKGKHYPPYKSLYSWSRISTIACDQVGLGKCTHPRLARRIVYRDGLNRWWG